MCEGLERLGIQLDEEANQAAEGAWGVWGVWGRMGGAWEWVGEGREESEQEMRIGLE